MRIPPRQPEEEAVIGDETKLGPSGVRVSVTRNATAVTSGARAALLAASLAGALGAALLLSGFAGCTAAGPGLSPSPAPTAAPTPPPKPFRWADAVLYFVVVDRFANGDAANDVNVDRAAKGAFHGGDLKGLTANLDEIASLGVDALWITPVVKNVAGFVTGAGFPDWAYHGYWADDFEALDPRFGTEADLAALVSACHARGIRVLLDVVYNHAGYESRYTKDPAFKVWLRTEALGTCGEDDVTACVSGLPDFKTELPEVADYLLKAQLRWARKSGVDGFRVDTVKHLDHLFWKEHRRRIRSEIGSSFFLLGEVWGGDAEVLDPWFSGDEMDAGFDFGFQGSVLGFVKGRGRAVAFDRYLKSREKVRPGYLLSHFLSSHDTTGALHQLGGDRALFRLAAALQMTTAGLPTIYYGEEVARAGGEWPENRSDMPWGARNVPPGAGKPRDEELRSFYKRLIAVRKAHPALSRGVHAGLSTDGDVYAFLRADAETKDAVVVALNRGASPGALRFRPPAEWDGAEIRELLSGVPAPRSDSTIDETLPPRSVRVYGVERAGR